MKRSLLSFFLFVSILLTTRAGTITYSSRLLGSGAGNVANNSVLYTYDDQYFDMSAGGGTGTAWHAANENRSVINYVRLRYTGGENRHYTTDWSVQVICTVDRWDELGGSLTPEVCTLQVNYDKDAGIKYTDISSFRSSAPGHKMKITIAPSGVSCTGVSGVPADVQLEGVIEVNRDHEIDADAVIDVDNTTNTCVLGTGPVNNTFAQTIEFHWDYIPGAEEYDLEWLFMTEYDVTSTPDFSKATRVTTSNQYYVINNAFDNGTLRYRIRAVSTDFATGTKRLEGEWTDGPNVITVCNIEKRNWSYNAAYAEEGKRKEVMTYFDGSTRARQSVTLSNTENTSLVAENMYDYEGRAAIQTLPAPSKAFRSDLRFFEYFSLNTNSSTTAYTKKDFDNDDNDVCGGGDVPAMKGSLAGEGAAVYYSENNTLKSTGFNALIPDINGDGSSYPFTHTVYSADGTVKKQSGVGDAHKTGSGHETKYLNASAAQEKLDRLFGNEVGYAEHYREKAVVDPNGQVSVSYENLSGQVVATCLRGDSPASLIELGSETDDSEPYMTPEDVQHQFVNGYDPASESYVSRENFVVTNINTDYDFTYKITAQQFEAMCHDTTYSCQYFLQITIKDDCGESVTATDEVYTNPITLPAITADALNTIHHLNAKDYTTGDFQVTFTVDFPAVGVYRIEKKLWLDESALDQYLVLYEHGLRNIENECITPLDELEAIYEAEIDMTECMTCEQYAAWRADSSESGVAQTYPYTDQMGNEFDNSTEYEAFLLAQCHPEIPAKSCEGLLAALKADMSPGGQYFESMITGHSDLSSCATSGTFSSPEHYIDALLFLSGISTCTFVDILGDWDDYTAAHGCNTRPATTDYDNLVANWDPCWADYLVRYHPEYCRYQRCTTLARSYDFEANLLNTDYTEATTTHPSTTTPYLVIATSPTGKSVLDLDPYFSTVASVSPIDGTNYTNMSNEINQCAACNTSFGGLGLSGYSATTSMWNWAKVVPEDLSAYPLTTTAETLAYNDARWSNFQKLYIATKAQYVRAYGCPALADTDYPPDNLVDLGPSGAFEHLIVAPSLPVDVLHVHNMNINDPESATSFEAVIADITDTIGDGYDPSGDYDDVPGLCVYSSAHLDMAINPASMTDPVTSYTATNNCGAGITLCDADTLSVPPSGENSYGLFVKISQVPFNYPTDNTGVSWTNSSCFMRISNDFSLPAISASTTASYLWSYVNIIKNAINSYFGTPYDFTCEVDPYSSGTGGSYTYHIIAPSSLGPYGSPSNLDLVILKRDSSGDVDTICGSQGNPDFVAGTEDCTPDAVMQPNCLCMQLQQINEFFYANDVSGSLTVDGTTYTSFEQYAAAQLNAVYGITDTAITTTNVGYWFEQCSGGTYQTLMQSPMELDADGEIASTTGNTNNPLQQEIDCDEDEPCQQQGYDEADFFALQAYEASIQNALEDFKNQYKAACLNSTALAELFKVEYEEKEYHYTLYYYDQAGNLVRTVPPNSVNRIPAASLYVSGVNQVHNARVTSGTPIYPEHSRIAQAGGLSANLMVTNYKYNTLNQLVEQQTPDGGETDFWYNDIGQLRFSQNAKQLAYQVAYDIPKYSYTIYDGQGRIKEVGENSQDTTVASVTAFYVGANYPYFPSVNGTEVTKTYYDDVIPSLGLTQDFLRKRVSSTTYEDVEDGSDLTYNSASHFSYDVHGNVNKLVQDYPDLVRSGNRYKTITYDYDLISGNVHAVNYQEGGFDQYFHKYEYDANNRITHAYTSNDKIHWQQDARYFYYLHGPLARVELGEDKVQGLDYAYSIQGWVKSVNANNFVTGTHIGKLDPGKDAYTNASYSYSPTHLNIHENVAQDGFGYTLSYFDGDYLSIGTNAASSNNYNTDVTGNMSFAGSKDLFNGNIKGMSTALYKPVSSSNPVVMPTMAKYFEYDQLNRIKKAVAWENTATASIGALTAWGTPATSDYYEHFNYDPNGNILHADRNGYAGAATAMDDIDYLYIDLSTSNQLDHITDPTSSGNYADDLDSQGGSNYGYDEIGNLVRDDEEDIVDIDWTVYGKIKKITKISGEDNIEFRYDPAGNRIAKIVKPKTGSSEQSVENWVITYYMRDAQGNTMAVYDHDVSSASGTATEKLVLNETNIYGSSRLGVEQQSHRNGIEPYATFSFSGYESDGTFDNVGTVTSYLGGQVSGDHWMGYKQYELSNHLGNVNVVISDRKISVNGGSGAGGHDHYLPDVLSATDYYSFGQPLPGRNFLSSGGYRYGMNGQEKDDEITGSSGSHYTAAFWEYDSRLGRRWNVDPAFKEKPWMAPYHAFSNKPIQNIDPNGANDDEFNAVYNEKTGQYDKTKISDRGGDKVDLTHFKGGALDGQHQVFNKSSMSSTWFGGSNGSKGSTSTAAATGGMIAGAADQSYGAWQNEKDQLTYTQTNGKTARMFTASGDLRSATAAKKWGYIKTGGLALNVVSTGFGYANLYNQYQSTGTVDKLDATEVGVGTVGTVANGMSYFGWGGAAAGTVGTATGFIGLGIQSGRIWYGFYKGMQDLEWKSKITNDPGEAQWNQWQNDNGIMNEGDLYGGH